jgi:hypothetical protein
MDCYNIMYELCLLLCWSACNLTLLYILKKIEKSFDILLRSLRLTVYELLLNIISLGGSQ